VTPLYHGEAPSAVLIHGDLAEPELVRDFKDWGQYRSWGELTASTGITAVTVNHRSAHRGTRMRDVTVDIEAALDYIDSVGEELGGRVVFCDGSRCLVCLDLLDQKEIAHDRMSPVQREAHDRIYGIERMPSPARGRWSSR
jgi:hypothetical protein